MRRMPLGSVQQRQNAWATVHSSMKALRLSVLSRPSRRAKRLVETHWMVVGDMRSMPHLERWSLIREVICFAREKHCCFACAAALDSVDSAAVLLRKKYIWIRLVW